MEWSFESVLRVLLAAYDFMGPFGAGLAAIFALSAIIFISALSHAAKHPDWRVLIGSAAVCVVSFVSYIALHHAESGKVRNLIAGSWTLMLDTDKSTYTCDDAARYAVEDKLSGESDLVETVGGVPKTYIIDLQRSVTPDTAYVYPENGRKNYRSIQRVGNVLIENYDRSSVRLRKCH